MLKCIKWLFFINIFLLLGGIAVAMFAGVGMIAVAVMGDQPMSELQVKTEHAVGVVDLSGEILSSENFRKDINKMVENDKIKAIVTRIDSPGGSVGASEEILRAIKNADEQKPVVCSLGNLAASGGLYSAVGCRKIFTNKGTLTGSIGVIFMTPNVSQVIERLGFKMRVIKSGQFKDAGSPFRPSTSEDEALLQALVDSSYEQFLDAIVENRSLDEATVRSFADGRVILGEQAVALGLADEIGGVEDAAMLALELSGDTSGEKPELVRIPQPKGIRALFHDTRGQYAAIKQFWTKPSLLYRLAW